MSTMTASQYYASVKKDRDKWRDEQLQKCMACNSTEQLADELRTLAGDMTQTSEWLRHIGGFRAHWQQWANNLASEAGGLLRWAKEIEETKCDQ